jgi:hypothetical protein
MSRLPSEPAVRVQCRVRRRLQRGDAYRSVRISFVDKDIAMQYPIDKYKNQAKEVFQTSLIENFSKWTNSRQIGNVFDTLMDRF